MTLCHILQGLRAELQGQRCRADGGVRAEVVDELHHVLHDLHAQGAILRNGGHVVDVLTVAPLGDVLGALDDPVEALVRPPLVFFCLFSSAAAV